LVKTEILKGREKETPAKMYPSYDGMSGREQKYGAHILRDAREVVENRSRQEDSTCS
jgi:hypothetical protein